MYVESGRPTSETASTTLHENEHLDAADAAGEDSDPNTPFTPAGVCHHADMDKKQAEWLCRLAKKDECMNLMGCCASVSCEAIKAKYAQYVKKKQTADRLGGGTGNPTDVIGGLPDYGSPLGGDPPFGELPTLCNCTEGPSRP